MRTPLIAGNWKMHKTHSEAAELCSRLLGSLRGQEVVEVVVCPPFTSLAAAGDALKGGNIGLGAQDLFWRDEGAFTGEISAPMLRELGCSYVIVGHSERRGRFGAPDPELKGNLLSVFGDNDSTVNRKLLAAFENGLRPILCIGETAQEREAGETEKVISEQLEAALYAIDNISGISIAYEPVWAIGTGNPCEPEEAEHICGLIREQLARLSSPETAEAVRILYGGSVNPQNIRGFVEKPSIDGALVGGASLSADSFISIIKQTTEAKGG